MPDSKRISPAHLWGAIISLILIVGITIIIIQLQHNKSGRADADAPGNPSQQAAVNIPMPEQPGLFPLVDGKFIKLDPSTRIADFPPNLQFVFFHDRVPSYGDQIHLYLLPIDLVSPKEIIMPRTTVTKSQPEVSAFMPGGAIELSARVQHAPDNPRLILISLPQNLEPGYYCLEDWAPFFINRNQLEKNITGLAGRWFEPMGGSGDATWYPSKQPRPTRSFATFHFKTDGAYSAQIKSEGGTLEEQGAWKLHGAQLTTTTASSNDGRPAGSVDTVEIQKLDRTRLVFKAPTTSGRTMTHTFIRIN